MNGIREGDRGSIRIVPVRERTYPTTDDASRWVKADTFREPCHGDG